MFENSFIPIKPDISINSLDPRILIARGHQDLHLAAAVVYVHPTPYESSFTKAQANILIHSLDPPTLIARGRNRNLLVPCSIIIKS